MFLQSLGKYLDDKASSGSSTRCTPTPGRVCSHYARWMAEHEYPYLDRPEILEYPTETWAAQDMRKSEVFEFAALRATERPSANAFRDRSQVFFRACIEGLEARPTRSLCRPVAVLMGTGWQQAWFQRFPKQRPPACAMPSDFGVPEMFTPQKTIAMRRAVLIGGTAVLATLAALIYAVARLLG